jgi:hypothetical protein
VLLAVGMDAPTGVRFNSIYIEYSSHQGLHMHDDDDDDGDDNKPENPRQNKT